MIARRWLAVLSASAPCPPAVSGGVHTALDATKAILCGADTVQMVSALLRGGQQRLRQTRELMTAWMVERGYESLRQMRGSMNTSRSPDAKAFERANYMRVLQTYRVE